MNYCTNDKIGKILQNNMFEVVDLNTLNSKSKLLCREERKYILHKSNLIKVLTSFAPHFAILEHVGKRKFSYESVYFDDSFLTYKMHHQGKRRRFKIRSRLYLDSDVCVFEVKLKKYRGRTDKRNMKYILNSRFEINSDAKKFLEECLKDNHPEICLQNFKPILIIRNERITFVSKNGGERITIDLNLVFDSPINKFIVPSDFVIVETKTDNGHGFSDKLLLSHGLRPQSFCSKYCIGLAKTGLVSKKNNFLGIIKKIEKLEKEILLPEDKYYISYSIHEDINNFVAPASSVQESFKVN